MPYLDAHHILVHRDGKTDEKYRRSYSDILLRNEKIIADFNLISSAKSAITALARDIDDKVLATDLVRRQGMAGQR